MMRATTSHTRYQLCVAASDVGDLIVSAGGWMCDRVHAGWDVSVAIAEPHDLRALQILGVTTLVADHGFESISHGGGTAAVAIAPDVFENNQHIRDEVFSAIDDGCTEVIVWGTVPSELHGRVERLQHRLSCAARAFKAQALAAAAIPARAVSATEDLYGTAPWYEASGHHADARRLAAGQQYDGVRASITKIEGRIYDH